MDLSLFFMFISAGVCLLGPATAAIILIIKRRASWLMFLLGAVSFTVSQLLLRIPLLGELGGTVWFTMFAITQRTLYLFLIALSAGVFEEAGRFIALRFVNRDLLTWDNGILFGLGHGGIEAFMLVGLPYVKTIADTLSGVNTTAALNIPSVYYLIGGIERTLAVALHIGFTMLVLYAVKRRKLWFVMLAVALHAVVDMFAVFLQPANVAQVWLVEGILALFAAAAIFITIKMKPALSAGAGGKI